MDANGKHEHANSYYNAMACGMCVNRLKWNEKKNGNKNKLKRTDNVFKCFKIIQFIRKWKRHVGNSR